MLYPVKLANILDQFIFYIPDPDQVKPVYENQLIKDPATAFPFWAKIWASSLALSSYLEKELQLVEGKKVLEIGAGIGLPSLTVAHVAESMIISDHAPEAVKLMEKNIEYLGLSNAKALCLDWNHFPDEIKADVVLLSDINYAPEQFEALLKLINRFLEEGSVIIITTPQRIMATPFVAALEPFIKRSTFEPVRENGQTIDISLLMLSA
jgi:predicted nicotinamide N-methyase